MLAIRDPTIDGITSTGGVNPVGQLGQLIRSRRLSKGLTQEQLEEITGISQHYISQIERGRVEQPGDAFLEALATGLEIPMSEIRIAQGWVVREVVVADGVTLPVRGVIPADAVRWVSGEGASMTEIDVLSSDIEGARSPFGLEVSGDCLRSIGILHGDVVIVEPAEGRRPRNGQLVVVQIDNDITLKYWREDNGDIRLEDGQGTVVHRVNASDEVAVLAFYVTFRPLAPRG